MKQPQETTKDHTLEDCYKFFATKEGADILPYSYIKAPLAYDDLIENCKDYYLFKDEAAVIENNKSKLKDILKDVDSIIEIGPGSKLPVTYKTVPLLSCATHIKYYYPVDISAEYLKDACTTVAKNFTTIKVEPIEFDIMEPSALGLKHLGFNGKKKACILLGSTLGNFTLQHQQFILKQIYNFLEPKDIFLITFDTNEDAEEILKAYNNKYFLRMVTSSLDYLCGIYNGVKQNANALQPKVIYDIASKRVNAFFVATSDFVINIPHYRTINVKRGAELRGIKAQKYSVEDAKLLLSSHFSTLETLDSSNKMKIFVCQRQD